MSDNDNAVIDALCNIMHPAYGYALDGATSAGMILDAIKAGKIPLPEEAPQIKALKQTCTEWEWANRTIRAEAKAEVERLTKERDEARADRDAECIEGKRMREQRDRAMALLRKIREVIKPTDGYWHNEAASAFKDVLPAIDALKAQGVEVVP